jgi:hypothetical protein
MGHFGTLWDILRHNLQPIQAPINESNPKQAYSKILHQVFFFFCTVSRKYSLNQPAFSQMHLRFPYLRSAHKGRMAELSGKKRKTGNILRSSQMPFYIISTV